MDTEHCAVDGWADAIPAPGRRCTATFNLIVRPADADTIAQDAPDTVVACTSGDPQITRELLTGIQPGDLLHYRHPDPAPIARRARPAHRRRPEGPGSRAHPGPA
ncbi:hypothetical protein [Streptomyces sp. NPDC020362]|uniref:hypothetical protein n=1 Tax=unclassified Streptomyces TaxID=2593676 RepID=UPI000A668BCF